MHLRTSNVVKPWASLKLKATRSARARKWPAFSLGGGGGAGAAPSLSCYEAQTEPYSACASSIGKTLKVVGGVLCYLSSRSPFPGIHYKESFGGTVMRARTY